MKKRLSIGLGILIAILIIFSVVTYYSVKEKSGLETINTEEFNKLRKSKKESLIYIGRPTCSYCKSIEPKLKKITKQNTFTLYYYNVDEEREKEATQLKKTLQEIDVTSVPTLVVVKDGKVIKKYRGVEELNKIESYIKEHKLNLVTKYF